MTANPVVPASAVEAAWRALELSSESWQVAAGMRAALAAAAVDLIAANTDDTKADALEEAAAAIYMPGQLPDSMPRWRRAMYHLDREGWRYAAMYRKWLRDRAAALRTDTTHKETP